MKFTRIKQREESCEQTTQYRIKEMNIRTLEENLIEGYYVSGKEQAEEFRMWERINPRRN